MRARAVSLKQLKNIKDEPWLDNTKRPYIRGECAWVPVKKGYWFDAEIQKRRSYLGKGYHMVGDVAVLHGTIPSKKEIDDLVRWKNPRGILHIAGYDGVRRIPKAELLYGEVGEVCHREHGYIFWLDPSKVMFAQGNREEKVRIANEIQNSGRDEDIADMFAGIGYFAIPAACSGGNVHAMELNPTAFGYLQQNVDANNAAHLVHAECGDCRDLLDGIYDRIIMGHFDAVDLLPAALEHVRKGSILHVHCLDFGKQIVNNIVEKAGYSCAITERRVKKYAPGRWHMVVDVILS
jgi:tRNA wybutosine-synthesizing protein 2